MIPPELILLPPSGPFSVYNFSCWARQTMVAALGRRGAAPGAARRRSTCSEIGARPGKTRAAAPAAPLRRRAIAASPSAGCANARRRTARGAGSSRRGSGRSSCSPRSATGSRTRRFARAVEGWERFMVDDGERLRPEACQSPVWDTALAVLALRAAGIPADDPQLRAAGAWLLARRGDGPRRLGDPPSGSRAGRLGVRVRQRPLSRRRRHRRRRARAARARPGRGRRPARTRLDRSACSRGAAAGAPSTSTTRRCGSTSSRSATSARSPTSRAPTSPRTRSRRSRHETGYGDSAARGLEWLLAEQEADGSWFGRWGVNHVYGTGAALPALEACGLPPDHPAIRRARRLARLRPAAERRLR